MTEPTERLPKSESDRADQKPAGDRVVNPQDLVYKGGYSKDPREIVENPAVAPQMLNQPGDLRDDLLEED